RNRLSFGAAVDQLEIAVWGASMTEADSPTIVSMQVAILAPCACSTGWNSPTAACGPCGCGAGGSVAPGAGAADGFPLASLFPAAAPPFAAGAAACSFCART